MVSPGDGLELRTGDGMATSDKLEVCSVGKPFPADLKSPVRTILRRTSLSRISRRRFTGLVFARCSGSSLLVCVHSDANAEVVFPSLTNERALFSEFDDTGATVP